MTNPFDRNFLNFLLGFSAIIVASFVITYFTGVYGSVQDEKRAAVTPALVQQK